MEIDAAQIYATLHRRFERAEHEDIQDAVAESHATAWIAREAGKVLHNVDAFCTVVAKRALSRELQRQVRQIYPDRDHYVQWSDLEGGSSLSEPPVAEEQFDAQTMLEEAPERYAEVLRLHYLEGKSLEEAARILGISSACIRKRHQRALQWARRRFVP